MRLRPRQVWGAGVIVAAVGLLALVALAAEQAPFDVDDDTGGIHVPSWGSVFVLGLVVLLMALWIILFVSAQRASGPLARVPRQRGLLNMLATSGYSSRSSRAQGAPPEPRHGDPACPASRH
jgi:hypothetical protein